eukprot:CAMPEP_0183709808 /NCGR_PEP_ID=MMETSP0737-20130205/5775_1 /TAXON_ID=385413 /ORGANISM="Thalassiosira miniscula, Strain CCMP1093" /LENGTH=442 /DNA_ID=CAMNT_0025938003 /DNA_START=158 /DNA_END=1486 /DNA_ORIENTATION=+
MCNPSQHPADIELGDACSTTSSQEFSTEPLIKRTDDASVSTCSTSPSKRKHRTDHDTLVKPNHDTGVGSKLLDNLPPTQQMILLSFLMFLFFGMHNILQEAIVNLLSNSDSIVEGSRLAKNGTLMLGYAEVIGVFVFSFLERVHLTKEGGFERVAPLRAYPMLTGCLFASSSLSNLSLSYINFPTKVVFRSCKLVPTMIIATIVNQRVFKSYEYLCALSICAGLVLFAMADYALDPLQYQPVGLLLVSGSVVADAILPNAQEHLFKAGSSRLEVTVFSNLFSFFGMTAITLSNGCLPEFVQGLYADRTLALYFGVYTVLSYISISCYMTLVKRFGGVTAVVLTTARKAMTLVLSFLLFPKGFSWLYVYGSALVLGAVMIVGICKKLAANKKESPPPKDIHYRSGSSVNGDGRSSSSIASSKGSELESTAEAILEGISKRAYV